MTSTHALLLEKVSPSADDELARHGLEVQRIDKGLGVSEVIEALKSSGDAPKIVGIRSKTKITKEVFDAVPSLMAIGAFCIGTDQIDLKAARAAGVAVFNAPFSSTRSVAELIVAEVVMLSRQIFPRSKAAHEGRWAKSATGAREVRGKKLGIIGYGHIGSQVSILAEALGMKVRLHDIDKKLPLGNAKIAASLDEILEKSDFVSLHVPDTELTRGMMGEEQIRKMKPGACLLNASRGSVVDIAALRAAIEDGHLAGAAIDVFPTEPAKENDPFANDLRGLENVILTPHIGGSTLEAQANIGLEVAAALGRYIQLGGTNGCVTLPQLDVPSPHLSDGTTTSRILNIHQNVPGVLSRINQVIAESEVNIVGQSLATLDDLGLLFIDVSLAAQDAKTEQLRTSISALSTSLRTRISG